MIRLLTTKTSFLFIAYLFFILSIFPMDTFILQENKKKFNLNEQIEVLESKTNDYSFQHLKTSTHRDQIPFQKNNKNIHIGFSSPIYWIRFRLQNEHIENENWILEIPFSNISYIEFYTIEEDGNYTVKYTGNIFPFLSRDVKHRYFLFNIALDYGEKKEFYIRIQSENPINLNLNLYELELFQVINRQIEATLYIYYGLLLSILIYNLVYFFYLRFSANFYLAIYVLCVWMYQITNDGFGFEFFWSSFPAWNQLAILVFLNAAFVFGWMFTKKFIKVSVLPKNFHSIFIVFPVIHGILAILPLLLGIGSSAWLKLLSFVSILGILTIGVCCYKSEKFSVIYLISGWLVLFFAFCSYVFQLVYDFSFHFNLLKIGFILQLFIHSIGLTDKIFTLKKEKEKNYKTLIEEQKNLLEQKENLVSSFTKFTPYQFIKLLGKNSITELSAGDFKKKEMTVLFADIRSFTQISENMTPEENFDFINTYFRVLNPVIRKYGGIIDKYIGDAVMVIFPNNPDNAVSCAVAMVKSLRLFNIYQKKSKNIPVEIGIGIHTGEMILGTVGDEDRMDTTVISDTVNIAARLENTTKIFGTTIIISQQTLVELDDPTLYNFRIIGKIRVRGKKKAVSAIELLHGIDKKSIKLKIFTKAEFEKGIINFHAKNFTEAIRYFKSVLTYNSKDRVTEFYLKKAIHYRMNDIDKKDDWASIELSN
ncbi:MAG: hypothetical protein H7A23_23995 [Leptospiraceae bacterium]|nr:hypothetical protein [Leptospiraceae bacterium]MCP5497627.1 hypothetical protein [Leptospiraceae bacterium]